jgi:hypothetical protein
MNEYKEIAEVIFLKILQRPNTMDKARNIVKLFVLNETITIIDNISQELLNLVNYENMRSL